MAAIKTVIVLLLTCICVCYAYSQKDDSVNKIIKIENAGRYSHGIGGAAGFTTGYGVSYRYYNNSFIFQTAFFPTFENSEHVNFSYGATVMYKIVESANTAFFIYESNHWRHKKNTTISTLFNQFKELPGVEGKKVDNYVNIGVGFGIETILWRRMAVNFMVGFGALENFTKMQPSVEGGVFYLF